MLLAALALPCSLWGQDVAEGEQLFKQHCTACHKVQGKLVGPQMAGVNAKYANDREWLYSWVKNSAALIASGDEKAVALYEANNKQQMTAFPFLTNEQIDNILAWVDEEDARLSAPPEPEVQTAGTGAYDVASDPTIYYALLGLVGVLVLIALLLVVITATLISAVQAKEGKEPFSFADVMSRSRLILQNKFVLTAITAFVVVGGSAKWIAEARTIGLHEGYMP
ncbi:MAG: cytochrome c, partial [Bacteroidetes bacterium]